MEKTYEMFWDCAYCGTEKLLGKTHRFCASCGAPQDPSRRYFPPEDEKVAVEDHVYAGVDRVCANCATASSRAAAHCPTCGAALGDDDGDAALVRAHRPASVAAASGPSTKTMVIVVVAALLVIGAVVAALTWSRPATLVAAAHAWERSIDIEAFRTLRDGAWCDARPGDAYQIQRERRQRGTRNVADGQTCKTVKTDRGDGTYTESQRCETRYRKEPVYDQWCTFRVDRWKTERTERAAGNALQPPPAWPRAPVDNCRRIGCTRLGQRRERYTVSLRAGEQSGSCAFPQAQWSAMQPGSSWEGEIGVLTGALDCDTLRPATR